MLKYWPQGLQIGLPNLMVSFINTWGKLKLFFYISTLTSNVHPLGSISTFEPIGMLDLGWTSALIPSVKALVLKYIYNFSNFSNIFILTQLYFMCSSSKIFVEVSF